MKLEKYRAKRDFTKTTEPAGEGKSEKQEPLRFVVHKHRASRLHWDLRLELDGVLKSWAIPKGPSLDPKDRRLAVMVEDHPLDYRFFEGVIPDGNYGAGPVMIWDRGSLYGVGCTDRRSSEEALGKGLVKGHVSFVLDGSRLRGEFALIKLKKGQENNWLLLKRDDAFTGLTDLSRTDISVASGRTMEEIDESAPGGNRVDLTGVPRGAMPVGVKPMLATLVDKAFDRQGWLFEIKWDGYRALAEVRNGQVRLSSRRNRDLNDQFRPVIESLERLPFDALFDGEVVVVDDSGRARFQLLQDYLRSSRGNLVYYVFDLLYFDAYDLRMLPLSRRKAILRQILPQLPHVKLSDHVETEGSSLFRAAVESDLEGIVAKDGQSPYRSGQRGREWLKIKASHREEAVIAGFTEPRGNRKGFGALVLGRHENGKLRYIGNAGGGFTDEQLRSLNERLVPLVTTKTPFETPPKTKTEITWVEPELVCEVRFSEWTNQGLMRHPVFLGLVEEKDPKQIRGGKPELAPPKVLSRNTRTRNASALSRKSGGLVAINDAKVRLSNLDKVFWPEEGYTKRDVIDYYREIASFILPYLRDRPESLHRFPDGIGGDAFFQKHVDRSQVPSWVQTVVLPSDSENRTTVYLLCQDEASLVYMANLGCIEINPWHSRIGHLDCPDFMVLDIDPLDAPFDETVRVAIVTHEVLTAIGAESFCKTSGATGLHIHLPLDGQYTYEQVAHFAKLVNLLVHARLPDTTSVERRPERRRGKVYLDFLQNRYGQTVVAPYCLRPRGGAPVSTPLMWEEVNVSLEPGDFTLKTIPGRLRRVGDLWKGVLGPAIDMEHCLARIEGMIQR